MRRIGALPSSQAPQREEREEREPGEAAGRATIFPASPAAWQPQPAVTVGFGWSPLAPAPDEAPAPDDAPLDDAPLDAPPDPPLDDAPLDDAPARRRARSTTPCRRRLRRPNRPTTTRQRYDPPFVPASMTVPYSNAPRSFAVSRGTLWSGCTYSSWA